MQVQVLEVLIVYSVIYFYFIYLFFFFFWGGGGLTLLSALCIGYITMGSFKGRRNHAAGHTSWSRLSTVKATIKVLALGPGFEPQTSEVGADCFNLYTNEPPKVPTEGFVKLYRVKRSRFW